MSKSKSPGSYKAIDKRDNRKFFMVLIGITIVLLALLYMMFKNNAG